MTTRKSRTGWFTIVATDLFSSLFATIVIIDSVTPKEIGTTAEAQLVQIRFDNGGAGCPPDGDSIVLAFRDSGKLISTIGQGFVVKPSGGTCIVSGSINIHLPREIADPCIVIGEFTGPDPSNFNVMITGGTAMSSVQQCQ